MKRISTAAIAALTVAGLAGTAAANHIDFFVEGDFALKLEPGETQTSDFTVDPEGDTILGSGRNVTIASAPGSSDGVITADLINLGTRVGGDDQGALVFSNSATTMGTLMLDYGTFTDFDVMTNAAGDAYASFRVEVSDVEPTEAGDLSITVVDTDGDTGTLTQSIVGSGDYLFVYDSFGANIDFASLDRINVTVTSTTDGADFRFEEITREVVIPEPASLALLGMGGLALLRRRTA